MTSRQRSGRGLLSSLWDRGRGGPEEPREYELVVIEGADAGVRFRIDRPQMQIGRSLPGQGRADEIRLTDRSVSSRHALLAFEDGRVSVEHLPSATNPTLVNGRRVKRRKRLRDGDRIVLGLVVLELQAVPLPEPAVSPRRAPGPRRGEVAAGPTDVSATLVVRQGPAGLVGQRFPLVGRRTALGRDEECDIVLDVGAVSRRHAAFLWQDDQLVLVHESRVNPTHVNGMLVTDRRRLFDGDEVRVSERVTFQVALRAREQAAARPGPEASAEDAEATRLTSPLRAAASAVDDPEATRIEPLPPMPGARADEPRAPIGAGHVDPEATFIEAPPYPVEAGSSSMREDPVTRVPSDAQATRIAEPPVPTAERPTQPDLADTEATRIEPPAPAPARPARFSDAEATRIAEPPAPAPQRTTRPDLSDAEATRIAEPPVPTAERATQPDLADAEATRIAEPPGEPGPTRILEPPEPSDEARTMIRPAPKLPPAPGPADETARTRIVDLDPLLQEPTGVSEEPTIVRGRPVADSERTVVRPAPRESDVAKTQVWPVPGATKPRAPDRQAAETVIMESPVAADADEEEPGD